MDWTAAAHRAIENLLRDGRKYEPRRSLAVIDAMTAAGTIERHALLAAHGSLDFVGTVIAHVTTAVHGGGAVPKVGGWYRVENGRYIVEPEFAAAWKAVR